MGGEGKERGVGGQRGKGKVLEGKEGGEKAGQEGKGVN